MEHVQKLINSEKQSIFKSAKIIKETSEKELTTHPNSYFYKNVLDSEKIMDPTCFSTEIRQFLDDEKNHLTKLFLKEQYECIIEVGCHNDQNAQWLSKLCAQYVGIDINKTAIDLAKRNQIPGKIEFFCTAVEDLNFLLLSDGEYPKRKVVLFPFNLFGNFINIEKLIAMFDMTGADIAMSNFNTKAATTVGRYDYYANCFGRSTVRVYDAEQGVLFKAGQQFQSIAHSPDYLNKVIHDISKYHGILMPFSFYGDLFLLTN